MNAKDLRGQTPDQLRDQLANLKKESYNLRFHQATGQLEKTSRKRAAQDLDALNPAGAGVVSDIQIGLHLDHVVSPDLWGGVSGPNPQGFVQTGRSHWA